MTSFSLIHTIAFVGCEYDMHFNETQVSTRTKNQAVNISKKPVKKPSL